VNTKPLTPAELTIFQKTVINFYNERGRHALPWRVFDDLNTIDPYKVTVSEVMLQQTQVNRVIEKYSQFLKRFPTVKDLASASLADVLTVWSGLGYYRRAKFLHEAAQKISKDFNGVFPEDSNILATLPGIGKNTAGAIIAYSFNKPVIFIETNIRTVYIHHFFKDQTGVSDAALMPLIEQTLDSNEPRIWYWALMDYGSYLKTTFKNPSKKSKHHVKQSVFKGSKREARGQVLKFLTSENLNSEQLNKAVQSNHLDEVLRALENEGMIHKRGNTYHLGK